VSGQRAPTSGIREVGLSGSEFARSVERHAVRGQRFKPEGIAQRGEGEVDVV
jgi:hypothetical protein